jgi:hypothetical protein
VAAVVVATNGFSVGKKGPSARERVSEYISAVDLVQKQMGIEIGQVVAAYRGYPGQPSSATKARLANAVRTLHDLQLRIAAVPVPLEASRLARLVSTLLQSEHAIAVEVEELAAFEWTFHTVVIQTPRLSAGLATALATVQQPKPHVIHGTKKQIAQEQAAFTKALAVAALAQADAVERYDEALGRLLLRLSTITPPPVAAPAYLAEVATLRATRAAGAALAVELRKPVRSRVVSLSRRFVEAARIAESSSRQRQEIAALKA